MAPTLLDKPGAFPTTTTTKISVRFVPLSPLHLPVKIQPMKTPQTQPSGALLQLAAHLENFSLPALPLAGQPEPAPLVSLAEKLETSVAHVRSADAFAARAVDQRVPAPASTRTVLPLRKTMHVFENPLEGLRNTEFRMEAPSAKSVKLVGNFTDWERSPLDLVQSYDGTWFTIVPLLPGTYSYRFIVDGQWLDDPQCSQHVPNPFGSEDAVMNVD